jgi:hypothetical protein
MKSFLKHMWFVLLLLIADTIIYYIILNCRDVLEYGKLSYLSQEIYYNDAILAGGLRFIYYYLPNVFLFYLLNKSWKTKRETLKITTINFGLYLMLSIFYTFLMPRYISMFFKPGFYRIILSTILGQIALMRIPYCRKLIEA